MAKLSSVPQLALCVPHSSAVTVVHSVEPLWFLPQCQPASRLCILEVGRPSFTSCQGSMQPDSEDSWWQGRPTPVTGLADLSTTVNSYIPMVALPLGSGSLFRPGRSTPHLTHGWDYLLGIAPGTCLGCRACPHAGGSCMP